MPNAEIIAFNKPYGVICQFSPHPRHESLKDYIPIPDYYPIGRLDATSEGLLLLTRDGKIQHQIAHPEVGYQKTYYAQLEGVMAPEKLRLMEKSMIFKEFVTKPAEVRLLTAEEISAIPPREPPIRSRKTVPDFWVAITLGEGKNRQVRRMTARVGYPCLRLIRVAIGPWRLSDLNLPLGRYRFIPYPYTSKAKQ